MKRTLCQCLEQREQFKGILTLNETFSSVLLHAVSPCVLLSFDQTIYCRFGYGPLLGNSVMVLSSLSVNKSKFVLMDVKSYEGSILKSKPLQFWWQVLTELTMAAY